MSQQSLRLLQQQIPKTLSDKAFADMKNHKAKQAQKRARNNKKRKADEDEPAGAPRLTSKQKRAMERAKKEKKVGVRYYETHNVKNKNKNRKTPASATEGHKAKRSKH